MRKFIPSMLLLASSILFFHSCGNSSDRTPSEVAAPSMQVCVDGKKDAPVKVCTPQGVCTWVNPCTGEVVRPIHPKVPLPW